LKTVLIPLIILQKKEKYEIHINQRLKGMSVSDYLKSFSYGESRKLFEDASKTRIHCFEIDGRKYPRYINEFWTSKQRKASSVHEISYRACFKPQLPRFFIKLLSQESDIVYDPFSGRGTTPIEAALLGRNVISNDINPLSEILIYPRFFIPRLHEIEKRLQEIPMEKNNKAEIDLSMFYDPKTEAEIVSIKKYLMERKGKREEDSIDKWIRMVATNRLTGHSSGFFSVYTLPPNQAVSPESQMKINAKRRQKPEYRDTKKIILSKSRSLLRNLTLVDKERLRKIGERAIFLTEDAKDVSIQSDLVQLTVTSPPFLDIVQYSKDNWLRCWFNSINDKEIEKKITMAKSLREWSSVMAVAFKDLFRVTKEGGWVAFEVGEIRRGSINLDEYVVPLGLKAGFECVGVVVNLQKFTKTSSIWGINNNNFGTNTNRIVLFQKR